jgi:hypothetical protein
MPRTYVPINSQVIGSTQAIVTFTSIPQTYTDLVLIVDGFTTHTDDGARGYIQFNTDTSTGSTAYSSVFLGVTASTKSTNKDTNAPYIAYAVLGNDSSRTTLGEINIMNYRNTSSWGLVLSKGAKYATTASGNFGTRFVAGTWRNTAAITDITLRSDTAYAAGTSFSLYGIASA